MTATGAMAATLVTGGLWAAGSGEHSSTAGHVSAGNRLAGATGTTGAPGTSGANRTTTGKPSQPQAEGLAGGTAAASAAAHCPRNHVCFWTKKKYKGKQWKVKTSNGVQARTAPAWFRNRATSLIVGGGSSVTLWNDVDCAEDPGPTFRAGARVPDLQTPHAYDDLMSCITA
ncbi:peptidase inhibitor family I36 protein [Spirillospora sp. CA-108201]